MFSTKITERFDTSEKAKAACEAIIPETNQKYERGSKTRITVKDNVLTIVVDAQNSRALDASKQNYTELASFVKSIEGV